MRPKATGFQGGNGSSTQIQRRKEGKNRLMLGNTVASGDGGVDGSTQVSSNRVRAGTSDVGVLYANEGAMREEARKQRDREGQG
jgi:hypothetical protein